MTIADTEHTVLRVSFSDAWGQGNEALYRDSDGRWYDDLGEQVADDDDELLSIVRTVIAEKLSDFDAAKREREARQRPHNPENVCTRATETGPCGAALKYRADFGAPGIGQHWECAAGHNWQRIGATFHDLDNEPPHELSIGDVR